MKLFLSRIEGLYHYRHMLKQLVKKDIKLKYRRSFLGYLWSVLSPLFTMIVMLIVFSKMFRFDIENYPVYLITGQILFNYMNEALTLAIYSITSNSTLLKKVYVPKYIFTVSKVTSSLVNLIFALGALIVVFIFTKTTFSISFLFIPVILLQLYIFTLGLGLFLAQAAVFFRDVLYIYNVLITAWLYLTPIFYPITALPEALQKLITTYNPINYYITQFRIVVLEGKLPSADLVISGFLMGLVLMLVGTGFFMKNQDKFILYI